MRTLSMRTIAAILGILAVLSPERAAVAADDDLSPRKVLQSIKRGRAYLISKQRADGSWSVFPGDRHHVGVTSLALLSLINSGMTPKDAAIRKGLTFLRRHTLPNETYDASLMLMVFAATKDLGDKDKIIKLVAKLEAGQIRQRGNAGSWTYHLNNRGRGLGGDRSNAQFAILALRDAVHAGVKVKRETWVRARKHWLDQQNNDGSWGYSGRTGIGSGSMTVAGIATLVITARMLDEEQDLVNGRPVCCRNTDPDPALAKAIRFLSNAFERQGTVVNNINSRRSNLFYYMYGLERAGRLSGRRFFGSHDWYREGVRFFVNTRPNLRDGSWTGVGLGENNPIIGTSMVLLFLSKGLAPVLVNKLKYGPTDPRRKDDVVGDDWNLHNYDARNLTEFVTQQDKWPKLLAWQTVEMPKLVRHGGDEEALDQAKVLLITGSKDPSELRQPSQVRILKNYIKRGGFIFVVGNCDPNSAFDRGFKELIRKMFPDNEAELKLLGQEHPVFRSEFRLLKTQADVEQTKLYGVDFGCRTAIIYAPVQQGGQDLSCLWAKWTIQDPPRRDNRLKTMVDRSMQIGINVIAYATGREPPQKLQDLGPRADKGSNDRLTRGFLRVAKLKRNGDWDVAPRALRELLKGLNVANGQPPLANTKKWTLFANDKNLFNFPIVYMHGRQSFTLSQPEKKQLKTYLSKRDCVLFADACCGSKEFDASFRELMRDLFADKNLKLKRIPLTNKLFTEAIGFNIKKVKRVSLESANKNAIIRRTEREVEPFLEGIEIDGRFVVIYSKYDISCALEQQSSIACSGYVRADAMKIGINILLYAMSQDAMQSQVGRSFAAHAVAGGRRVTDEPRRNAAELQRGEDLLALFDVAAQIPFAVNDQCRRLHVAEVLQRALFPDAFGVVPAVAVPVFSRHQRQVARTDHADEVRHAPIGDGGRKVVRVADRPVGHVSAVTAAADPHPFRVDKGLFLHVPGDGLHVAPVGLSPFAFDGAAVFVAVSLAAPRVAEHDHVTGRGEYLKLVEERFPVLAMRPAVYGQQRGVFFARFEAGRLHHPEMHRRAVGRIDPDRFRFRQVDLLEQFRIELRELFDFQRTDGGSVGLGNGNFRRADRVADDDGVTGAVGADVSQRNRPPAFGMEDEFAAGRGNRRDVRFPFPAEIEYDPFAVRSPVDRFVKRAPMQRLSVRLISFVVLCCPLPAGADDTPPAIRRAAGRVKQIIAHRGASKERPECTLAALKRAIEVGATAVEVDVRKSKDGHLVILHDKTLDRTTNGSGPVGEKTLRELKRLDAGSWFAKAYRDERIPTLKETLVAAKGKIAILLDLKEQGEAYDAKVIAEVKAFGEPKRTIIGVRSVEQAKRFRRLLPAAKQLGLIPKPESIEAFAAAGVETIRLWPRWLTDRTLIPRVRKAKRLLHLNGTSGLPDEIAPLLAHRPDSLSSDDPGRLRKTLREFKAGK
eukprot:g33083.t1